MVVLVSLMFYVAILALGVSACIMGGIAQFIRRAPGFVMENRLAERVTLLRVLHLVSIESLGAGAILLSLVDLRILPNTPFMNISGVLISIGVMGQFLWFGLGGPIMFRR